MPFPDEFTDVYTTGTIAINNGSTAIVGTGTYWVDNARAGDRIVFPNGTQCTIRSVDDEGEITLRTPYVGTNLAGASYTIEYDYPYRVSGLDLARNATLIGQSLLAAAVVFHFGTEAPDNSLGVDGQWGHREVGSSLLFYKKDAGEWGDPLSVASVYGDGGGIFDTNGNEQLLFGETASAVNYWQMTNAATGGVPKLQAVGGDANVSARFASKGTGAIFFEVNGSDAATLTAARFKVPALNAGGGTTVYGVASITGPSAAFAGTGVDGILNITTGTGGQLDEKLQIGVLDGNYAWIQASKPGTGLRTLRLNPSGGLVYTGGALQVADATASSSSGTGSGIFGGGIGVAEDIYFGGAADGPTVRVRRSSAIGGGLSFIDTNTGGQTWQFGPGAGTGAADKFSIYNQTTTTRLFDFEADGDLNVLVGDVKKAGTAFTNPDYVFEHYYQNGRIERVAGRDGATAYRGLMSLDELREYTRENYRLPGLTDEPIGIFTRADVVLEKIEEQALYILHLHERIKGLEQQRMR